MITVPSANGAVHTYAPDLDAIRAAAELRLRGIAVCRVDAQSKRASSPGWTTRSAEARQFDRGDLVSIVTGWLSDYGVEDCAIVGVDLDAKAVELADKYLPETGMIEGRPGKPRSHRYYLVPVHTIPRSEWSQASDSERAATAAGRHPGPETKSYRHADTGKELIRLCGSGAMLVCPPSTHTSGEVREWEGGAPDKPARVVWSELRNAANVLATACGWVFRRKEATADVGESGVEIDPNDPLIRRAVAYLDSLPYAVSGQGGRDATFWAARVLVYGFDLGVEVAYELMADRYNPHCVPPWDDDLHQFCVDADAAPFDKPRGWLRDGNATQPLGDTNTNDGTSKAGIAKPTGWTFSPVNSQDFAAGDYKLTYLVQGYLVAGQPMVVAGPQKTLKTSTLIDLAVSLASGTKFLGKFDVEGEHRVAFLSGFTGEATIQETARRVCAARCVRLPDLDILWQFTLPKFASAADVKALSEGLKAAGVEVVVIDPLYLCLGVDVNAANLYEVGARLAAIAGACRDAGATPIVAHHANRQLKTGDTMELSHLSYAGIAEFARQWILINRMTPYQGDGRHELVVSVGGSAGHGGLWSVRIDEGTTGSGPWGRAWNVSVSGVAEARERRREEKERQKLEQETQLAQIRNDRKRADEDEADKLALHYVGRIAPQKPDGLATATEVATAAGVHRKQVYAALRRLDASGRVEFVRTTRPLGSSGKATQDAAGYRVPVGVVSGAENGPSEDEDEDL